MRDQMQELFRVALGLAEPWVVSKIEFSEEQRQLELWLDFLHADANSRRHGTWNDETDPTLPFGGIIERP